MSTRLPAEERKAAVLKCACGIFSTGSYRGTTTAEIARRAGVTEPILYRHFQSKRELYLAVLDESWRGLRELWDKTLEQEQDPRYWLGALGRAYFEAADPTILCADLWVQALTEASDDPEIRKFLRKHMLEVHAYVVDIIERSQAEGGILPDRDARVEAWLFIAIGLIGTVGRRLGGLLEEDFPRLIAERRKWMAGVDEPPPETKAAGV
ncbi:MAG TPA: TetR/AcrR family transcriptional regulator [Gaiellaceae bacterium]|nr:TetR/AcrR family transcriptional regulator [Gaiellaceae bacterium]